MTFLFFCIAAALLLTSSKCEDNIETENPEEQEVGVELLPLKSSGAVNQDWVFEEKPEFVIHVENPNEQAVETEAKAKIMTD